MGTPHSLRGDRQIILIGELRRGQALTLESFATYLARKLPRLKASKKTIQRDMKDLQERLKAPIEYVPSDRSYRMLNNEWHFPESLIEAQLFATLWCLRIAEPLPPMPCLAALHEAVQAQLAVADPDVCEPDILNSLIHATSSGPRISADVSAVIETAWRDHRVCRIHYASAERRRSERDVEIHGLFLAEGAWYTRTWCRDQHGTRNFALHRIESAELLDEKFVRRQDVLAALRTGQVFSDEVIFDVVLRCNAAKSVVIRERIWFPGQAVRELADGGLEISYPSAPRKQILWWVLSYGGSLTVLAPPALRQEVANIAMALAVLHADEPARTSGED